MYDVRLPWRASGSTLPLTPMANRLIFLAMVQQHCSHEHLLRAFMVVWVRTVLTASCICTLGLQLVVLLWEVMKRLRSVALLEEVRDWGGLWGFIILPVLSLFLLSFKKEFYKFYYKNQINKDILHTKINRPWIYATLCFLCVVENMISLYPSYFSVVVIKTPLPGQFIEG